MAASDKPVGTDKPVARRPGRPRKVTAETPVEAPAPVNPPVDTEGRKPGRPSGKSPMSMGQLTAHMDELRLSLVQLNGRITTLSEALSVVNDVQRRLLITERLAEMAKREAEVTKETADRAITRDEFDRKTSIDLQNTVDFRKKVLQRVYTVVVITIILLLGITAYLFESNANRAANSLKQCRAMNAADQNVQNFVQDQKKITLNNSGLTSQVKQEALDSLDRLSHSFPVVDCTKIGHE